MAENRFRKYAQPQQPQGVMVRGPDPMLPGQIQQQGLGIQGAQLGNQERAATLPFAAPKAQADATAAQVGARVDAATAPAQITSANAKSQRDVVDAETAQRNFETTGGAGAEQAKAASFFSRALQAGREYDALGRVEPSHLREAAKWALPDSWVNAFSSQTQQAADVLQRDFIAATLRYESGAAIPPEEFQNQAAIYFPQPGDDPATLDLKRRRREVAIDALRLSAGPAGPLAEGTEQAPGATGQAPSIAAANATGVPPAVTVARGATVREADAELSTAIDRLVRMGRPFAEADAFVRSQGANPIDPRAYAAAVEHARRNPAFRGSYGAATRERPTTLRERVSASPLGSYLTGARSGLTAGFDDELIGAASAIGGGDYTQARDAANANKKLVLDANPGWGLGGQVTGGTLGALLGYGGLNQLAQGGSRVAGALTARGGIGADAGFGALYGAGETNENRLGGAVMGGAFGAGGNLAGRGIAQGIGGAISPSGGELRPLYDMGVRPSIGQRTGGVVDSLEQKLESVPFVGDAITGTRQRARDQFQIGLFNDALGEVGARLPDGTAPGTAPHAFAQRAIGDALDQAERGMAALPDAGLAQDIGSLQQSVGRLTDSSQQRFQRIWGEAVARRFQGGQLTGPAYKDAMSDLGAEIRKIRGNQSGDGELASALEQAQSALYNSARRNSSPEAVAQMDAANRAYAKLVQIENAARRRGGDIGTFSPRQYEAAAQQGNATVRDRGYLRGDALNGDIAQLGLRLGDVVPNSGTVDRAVALGAAGGAGMVAPQALIPLGVLGALNAPGVRRLTTGAMAPRTSPQAQRMGDAVRRLSDLTGRVGAGTAIGLMPR